MIRTYRCACGWSARRKSESLVIECGECHRLAEVVSPKPGPKPAAPDLQRRDFRVRPLGVSVQLLGEDEARRIGRDAIDDAARRKHATRRAKQK